MILVSQWYTPGEEQRRKELQRCRSLNEASGLFDVVEYLDGDSRRWSFGELVNHCNEKYAGKSCVIANTDIALDSSYGLRSFCKENRLVALTRWENPTGPRFIGHQGGDRYFSGSQDSWAFIAGSMPPVDIDIPMGVVACDNVIVGWAVRNGVEVVNPAISVRTMHHHEDKSRPERHSVFGYYGYPELTASTTTGSVLCHHWPTLDGRYEMEMEIKP